MELNELKAKFEDLKKRLNSVEKTITVAETQRTSLIDRIKTEFGIEPNKVKETIETMKTDIATMKTKLESALTSFETTLSAVEKTINE
jgi:chromosome segregation ATPase